MTSFGKLYPRFGKRSKEIFLLFPANRPCKSKINRHFNVQSINVRHKRMGYHIIQSKNYSIDVLLKNLTNSNISPPKRQVSVVGGLCDSNSVKDKLKLKLKSYSHNRLQPWNSSYTPAVRSVRNSQSASSLFPWTRGLKLSPMPQKTQNSIALGLDLFDALISGVQLDNLIESKLGSVGTLSQANHVSSILSLAFYGGQKAEVEISAAASSENEHVLDQKLHGNSDDNNKIASNGEIVIQQGNHMLIFTHEIDIFNRSNRENNHQNSMYFESVSAFADHLNRQHVDFSSVLEASFTTRKSSKIKFTKSWNGRMGIDYQENIKIRNPAFSAPVSRFSSEWFAYENHSHKNPTHTHRRINHGKGRHLGDPTKLGNRSPLRSIKNIPLGEKEVVLWTTRVVQTAQDYASRVYKKSRESTIKGKRSQAAECARTVQMPQSDRIFSYATMFPKLEFDFQLCLTPPCE